jgi:Tfp pilus assembly protein PilF
MDRLEKLKEYLSANPADSFLNHALALEYIKMGEMINARNVFEKLLERDPEYVGSYYHLAKLFESGGDRSKALEWYEKGMVAAQKSGDRHALGELRTAYDDLVE